MRITLEYAATWFENRAAQTPMQGAKKMFMLAVDALRYKEAHRWIPVAERLPENDNYVLVVATGNFEKVYLEQAIEFATYTEKEGWVLEMWPEMENPVVTYWMPVPDRPDEPKEA